MTNYKFSNLINQINTLELSYVNWNVFTGLKNAPLAWFFPDAPAIQVTGMFIVLFGDSADALDIAESIGCDLQLTFNNIDVYIFFAPWSRVEPC